MILKVTLAQLKPYIANPDRNLERIKDVVSRYYNKTDLIIFPELYLLGYHSKDLIYRLAESKDSPRIREILKLSREYNTYIITGFVEWDDKYDVIYNSALLASPDESIRVYRKRHLPDFSVFDEGRYFRRWDGNIELWDINGFKTGMLICYDVFFPEISRAYTYLGAKLLIAISATPDFSRPLFHILTRARAIENTVYFIWVNNVGTFDGIGFAGGSLAITPLGEIIYEAPLMKEDIRTVELNLDEVKRARVKRPVVRDISYSDVKLLEKCYRINQL